MGNCTPFIIPTEDCKNQTFEWLKRNDSERIIDNGLRYSKDCTFQYNCSEGSCVTNNDETCLDEEEEIPIFKCSSNKESNQLSTTSPSDTTLSESDPPYADLADNNSVSGNETFGWAWNDISLTDLRAEKGIYNDLWFRKIEIN